PGAWAAAAGGFWGALAAGKLAAGGPPNVTAVAPVRSVPVSVPLVPPATGPVAGATAVRVGAAKSSLTIVPVAWPSVTVAPTTLVTLTKKLSSGSNVVSPLTVTVKS